MQPNHNCGDDRGVVSDGGRTGVFARHRQRPVSSTSSEKLSKVRIATMLARIATLVRVGWLATVG